MDAQQAANLGKDSKESKKPSIPYRWTKQENKDFLFIMSSEARLSTGKRISENRVLDAAVELARMPELRDMFLKILAA